MKKFHVISTWYPSSVLLLHQRSDSYAHLQTALEIHTRYIYHVVMSFHRKYRAHKEITLTVVLFSNLAMAYLMRLKNKRWNIALTGKYCRLSLAFTLLWFCGVPKLGSVEWNFDGLHSLFLFREWMLPYSLPLTNLWLLKKKGR